ncbi:hypothetical protein WJU23_22215 [Prosthecobacter sp. SYSU 5D2]|uniref:hypothetical protein n=1 Tax=Prosthecobacter sp. SYSU 5D2 TaxID=3134134 RepID=UPI0031FF1026
MQNSQLFRRGVVLPQNREAEASLRLNDVSENTPVRYLKIGNQQEFELLWGVGIFQRINAYSNGLIDDYEECFVDASSMPAVLKAIKEIQFSNNPHDMKTEHFLVSLSSLASEAASLGRPLLFVL